jgi:hypothetical protein
MDYKNKYLKYKKKYFELKKNRNSWVNACGLPRYTVSGEDYLKDVNISDNIKNILMQKLFLFLPQNSKKKINLLTLGKIGNFNASLVKIFNLLNEINLEQKKESWIKCENNCYNILKDLIDKELKSTAYILRAISNSVIQHDDTNIKLEFVIKDNANFTGIWDIDKKFISINSLEKDKKSRLIMGFGPSASGKTFWAKSIIKMLSTNEKFPNAFLSIDGGIYREQSVMYQIIIKSISNLCNRKILGLSNLFSNIHGLFETPKKKIKKYLKKITKKDINISLYVPETLGKCLLCRVSSNTCLCADDVVKTYKNITKDENWIGLFIWQHENGEKLCPFDDNFKCKGTMNSGKSRELDEGKKYSSKAYYISFHGGFTAMKNAPGGRIEIHNGGGYKINNIFTQSIIKEYKIKSKRKLLNNVDFKKMNAKYVDENFDMKHKNIFFNFNFNYNHKNRIFNYDPKNKKKLF